MKAKQIELQQNAREFALKEVLPVAWNYDEMDETPLPVPRKAFDTCIMNVGIPKEYGGRGLGLIEAAILTEGLAAACPSLATSIFDNSLGMDPLLLSENEEVRQRYLPPILNDFKLVCLPPRNR